MPRWLSSLLIAVGFLALVALALLPKNVTVIVDVDDSSRHQSVYEGATSEPAHAEPAPTVPPTDRNET